MSLAERTLARLLERGERARLRGSKRALRESFKALDSPFWALSLDEREALYVRMRQAAACGAVLLRWAAVGGDDRPLETVELANLDRLATFLGRPLRMERADAAADRLQPWAATYPRVADIVETWRQLKPVRGLGPSTTHDLEDALRVLDTLSHGGRRDQVLRALSVQLFGDSKRIEALGRHLDVLTSESLASPARPVREVFAGLGLVKAAMPFLVSGQGRLALANGEECPVAAPYIGVAPEAVGGFAGEISWILTIENLTTFHQVAAQIQSAKAGLAVYTGGMPSPNWCRAYRTILDALPPAVPAYHWGDVDEGGFRIAAHIRGQCIGTRAYRPWLMAIDAQVPGAVDLGPAALRAMQAAAARAGWSDLALSMTPFGIEQEALAPQLPPRMTEGS
jgi:hypothetical protein